jgi:hypothetical protein
MDEWTLGRREMGARTFGRMVKNMIPTCHDATMMTPSPPITIDAFRLQPTVTTTVSGVPPTRALYPSLPIGADVTRAQQVCRCAHGLIMNVCAAIWRTQTKRA